jgi:RraA family protein
MMQAYIKGGGRLLVGCGIAGLGLNHYLAVAGMSSADMSTQAGRNKACPATADLTDAHIDKLQVADGNLFKDYGGRRRFGGRISTVRCFENNPLVRSAMGEPGAGRVLVVDGGGSLRRALLGDNIAELAVKNGWEGVIIYGAIRDAEQVSSSPSLVCTKEVDGSKDTRSCRWASWMWG